MCRQNQDYNLKNKKLHRDYRESVRDEAARISCTRPSVNVQRFKFNSRARQAEETVSTYVSELQLRRVAR